MSDESNERLKFLKQFGCSDLWWENHEYNEVKKS